MIKFSDRAVKEIKRIIEDQCLPEETGVRLGLKGGGCSGFSYTLGFETEKNDFDVLYEDHGIKIIVDIKSNLYLNGTTIDFNDKLLNRGFVFDNPNAKSNCHCGSSFSV